MAKVIYLVKTKTLDIDTFAPGTDYNLIAVDPFDGSADIASMTKLDVSKFSEAQLEELVGIFELMNRTVNLADFLPTGFPNKRVSTGSLIQRAVEATTLAMEYKKQKGN